MVKKIAPNLIRKYDIANRILHEFAGLESRYILFSIIKKPKSVQEISDELKIPQSTVYKKIQALSEVSLISMKRDFLDNGRIVQIYQSNVKDIHIDLSKFEPVISLSKNPKLKK